MCSVWSRPPSASSPTTATFLAVPDRATHRVDTCSTAQHTLTCACWTAQLCGTPMWPPMWRHPMWCQPEVQHVQQWSENHSHNHLSAGFTSRTVHMRVHHGREVYGLTLHPVVLAATAAATATTLSLRRLLVVATSLCPHAASLGLHAASLTPHAMPRIVHGSVPAARR